MPADLAAIYAMSSGAEAISPDTVMTSLKGDIYIVGATLLSTLFSCGHKEGDGHGHEDAEVKETETHAHGADEIILAPEVAKRLV